MKITLALSVTLALALGSASATSVTITFIGSELNHSNLTSPWGAPTTLTGEEIASVNGVSILGGALSLSTIAPNSTSSFPCGYKNNYGGPLHGHPDRYNEGTFTIIGSVFGTNPGSILMTGILGSSEAVSECAGNTSFWSEGVRVTYVNPALQALGISPGQSFDPLGHLQVIQWWVNKKNLKTASWIEVTAIPEPGTLSLVGVGLLGIGKLLRRLRRR